MATQTLVPRKILSTRLGAALQREAAIALDPRTESISVRIARPTAARAVGWDAAGRIRITLVVEIDGVEHRTSGSARGGPVVDNRPGRKGIEYPEYVLTWNLPTGFFAKGGEPEAQWKDIKPKRWGETAKSGFRAWVEVEHLEGQCDSEIELLAEVTPAPVADYHSSLAYQNAASAYETSGGDGVLTMSFTAGDAGSDRAAFVFGATSRDGLLTAAAVTYDSSITNDLGDTTNTYWRGAAGVANHTLIGTGAKTLGFSSSGGSGSQYSTYLGVISLTGANQSDLNGTVGTAGADSGTALSITVGSPAAGSIVVDGWAWAQANSTDPTIGANQTSRTEQSQGFGADRLVMSTQAGSDGGVMSWTKAHSLYEYVGMAVEIKAAGSGSIVSGTWTVAGVGAFAGVGRKTAASTWSSAGVGSMAWTGRATVAGTWSVAGVAASNIKGTAIRPASWSAAGVGALSATGFAASVQSGTFTMAGAGALAAIGRSTATTIWSSAGVAALAATGGKTTAATWSSAGIAILAATGRSTAAGTWSSAGNGALAGTGLAISGGSTASMSGVATAAFVGEAIGAGATAGDWFIPIARRRRGR